MLTGMSVDDNNDFLEKISATAIVNQAILKCLISGVQLDHDSVIAFIGDYADPTDPAYLGLIVQIQRTIDEVLAVMDYAKVHRQPAH